MDERDRQLALEYFKAKDPNPGRIGCPDKVVLKQLAKGQLEASSEWYTHFRNCGACTAEAEQIRRQIRFRRNALMSAAVAAAVLVGVVLGFNPARTQPSFKQEQSDTRRAQSVSPPALPPESVPPASSTTPTTVSAPKSEPAVPAKNRAQPPTTLVIASLDYRRFAPTRGDADTKPPTPRAGRGQGLVEIVLPIASAIGRYEVQIVDQQSLAVQARTRGGLARLQPSGATVLSLQCDLRSLAPGTYSVALRPANGQWSLFPIEIH